MEELRVAPRRMAWSAVFAGIVVALVVQLALSVLGLAIGLGTIDPLQERNPLEGLGMGSVIWWMISAVLALFAGGWVAGRLSSAHDGVDSALHGVVTWGLATLLSVLLITTTVGKVVSGTSRFVGGVLGAAGKAVPSAPELAQTLGIEGVDLSSIKQEARKLLAQTGKKNLQPNRLERRGENVGEDAKATAEQAAKTPEQAQAELDALIERIFAQGKDVLDAADKQAIVNVLVARTDLSREEAGKTVDQWQTVLQNAKAQLAAASQKAEQKTREVTDRAASGLSKAAFWAFFAMLLGLAAAGAGGWLGSSRFRGLALSSRPL